jgi:hypothetical protein
MSAYTEAPDVETLQALKRPRRCGRIMDGGDRPSWRAERIFGIGPNANSY